VFGRHVELRSEDRNNPGNSGNAKAEYNVLFIALLFTRKMEKVAKTTGHRILDLAHDQ